MRLGNDGRDGQTDRGTELYAHIKDGTDDALVLVFRIGDGVDLTAHPGRRETETVDNKGREGELPVGGAGLDLRKYDGRADDKAPTYAHDDLGAGVGKEAGHRVETHNQADTVDNITTGRDQRVEVEHVLEGQRRVKDHGVVGGCEADDDHDRGEEPARLPDVEGHNRVVDSRLEDNKCDQEADANQEGGKSPGGTPTSGGGLGQVVNDGNDTNGKERGTGIIDTAVDNVVVGMMVRDDEKSGNREGSREDGCDKEDPLPSDCGIKDTTQKDTNRLAMGK